MTEPITIGDKPTGNRRVLILAGAAVALILAVLVLPGVLFGGGSGGDDLTDLASPVPEPGAAAPTTTAVPVDGTSTATGVLKGKNPFTPLVETAAAATSGDTAVVTGTDPVEPLPLFDDGSALPFDGVSDFPVDPGSDPLAPVPTTEGAPLPETDVAPPPPSQPNRVSLLEVFSDPAGQLVASVRVNDITYQVTTGQAFAMAYRVLELDGTSRCAQLLFGYERFGLCEGEEALK